MGARGVNIAVLMPTYGRPTLVANCLAMFQRQDHPPDQCRLLILDDMGQLSGDGPNWRIHSTTDRWPALYAKYTSMYRMLDDYWPQFEAIAIMEDDDLYGPEWLSAHAKALQGSMWSKPSQIYCTYDRDILKGDKAFLETKDSCRGRFFASCAVRREMMDALGGFPDLRIHGADLHFLSMWERFAGPPGDPCAYAVPQYVYGWGRANHVSGGHVADKLYNLFRPMDATPHVDVVPALDAVTQILYPELWQKEVAW
jgi:hypothetical protein